MGRCETRLRAPEPPWGDATSDSEGRGCFRGILTAASSVGAGVGEMRFSNQRPESHSGTRDGDHDAGGRAWQSGGRAAGRRGGREKPERPERPPGRVQDQDSAGDGTASVVGGCDSAVAASAGASEEGAASGEASSSSTARRPLRRASGALTSSRSVSADRGARRPASRRHPDRFAASGRAPGWHRSATVSWRSNPPAGSS